MSNIQIKQNRKETYIDLSKEKIFSKNFFQDFRSFVHEISSFLSGGYVSLILPEIKEAEYETLKPQYEKLIEKLQIELNKKNISLKASIVSDDFLDNESKSSNETLKMMPEEKKQDAKEMEISEIPETLYIKANLRAGQLIRYPGNVFIFGDVNPSAEIIAAGDIIIWGNLRGVAHAGAAGDEKAIIAAHKILSGQLRISNIMKELSPDEIKTLKNNKSSASELAKIQNNEIIIS